MRTEWIHRRGSDRLIVFYAGWALDHDALAALPSDCDVLRVQDYRDEALDAALLAPYAQRDVIAYSLGVAVAARQMAQLAPRSATAICGSCDPHATIGAQVYDATAAQLTPKSLAQFARRAGAPMPQSPALAALTAELTQLASRPAASTAGFTRIYAARADRIFPPAAMTQAWAGQEIRWIDGPHWPFARWHSWQEMLS